MNAEGFFATWLGVAILAYVIDALSHGAQLENRRPEHIRTYGQLCRWVDKNTNRGGRLLGAILVGLLAALIGLAM